MGRRPKNREQTSAAAPQHVDATPTREIQLASQVKDGPVGVFPQPKQETRVVVPEPVVPAAPLAVFYGRGMFGAKIGGKVMTIRFRPDGTYLAQGEEVIAWLRGRGFVEKNRGA